MKVKLKPKMDKNLNPSTIKKSTIKEDVSKKRDSDVHRPYKWVEDYLDLGTFRMTPVSEAYIERLSRELIIWADSNDPKSLRLNQFVKGKKIPHKTFDRWVEKYPMLGSAKEYAMMSIADKREVGAATREYADNVLRMMPIYDHEWKALEQWRSSLKDDSSNAPVTINLPNIITPKE